MHSVLVVLLLGAASAPLADAAAAGANPIRKVVTLMQDMQKEIEAEGAKEKELFDKFMCFCQGNTAEMEKGIADGKAKVEELSGKLTAETAEKSQLELDVVVHKKDKAAAEQDLEKAASLRSKEQSDYEALAADYKTNIASMGSAIGSLEKGMGASALLQVPGVGSNLRKLANSYTFGTDYQREKIASFLEQSGDYAPGSGQIVGILKAMKDEMEADTKKAGEEEAASAEGFGELKASKEAEIATATEAVKTKTARAGELAVSVVQTQDDIEDTDQEVADTQGFLATLMEACPKKEKEWEARSKTRAEEIQGISEAIGILNDDDALDVFKKAAPSAFVEEPHRYGFLQQRSGTRAAAVQRAKALIDGIAQSRVHSPRMNIALYMVRNKLNSRRQAPSFGNITGMVDDMIDIEAEEQHTDDHDKPWCNGEFEKEDREEKAEKTDIAALEAELEEESDAIAALEEEIKGLGEEIAGLDKSVAQATEQRKIEHAEYQETATLTQTAIELIAKAKNRLQKFYNPTLYKEPEKVEEGAFFAQVARHSSARRAAARRMPEMPETFGGSYEKSSKSGGVMALMDSITKELETSLKDAEYDEKTAQKDYVALMEDSQKTRSQDVKSITDKEAVKAEIQGKKTVAKEAEVADLKDLEIIHKYVQELHGSCDFILENYDVRKQARTAEVESLKNAKAILAGAH